MRFGSSVSGTLHCLLDVAAVSISLNLYVDRSRPLEAVDEAPREASDAVLDALLEF